MNLPIKYIIVFSLLMLGISAFAQEQEPYFCTTEGATCEYLRTYTNGDVKWRHTMKILSFDENKVGYSSQFFNANGKPRFKRPAVMEATISSSGVEIDVAEAMAAIFRSVLGGGIKVVSEGDKTLLPATLTPGDTLPSAYCSIKAMGMTMKISVTERKVLFFETISTDAGVFNCIVVQEHKVEKGMGRNRVTTARTWYARGVGMVRHDTYNSRNEIETSEILQIFHCNIN